MKMSEEAEDVIRVLYDYTYSDDSGEVTIKAGDIYRLVEKTNNEWWQVYDPSDADKDCFFVPAQYVEVVPDASPLKTISDLDKLLNNNESCSGTAPSDYEHQIRDCQQENVQSQESAYSNNQAIAQSPQESVYVNKQVLGQSANESPYGNINLSSKKRYSEPDGDYVNLDQFREASGIKPLSTTTDVNKPNSSENVSSSAQDVIQGIIQPPLPEEGTFVRVLVAGMPWDIYKEHSLQRLYYVNRETGERMWKPPRREKPVAEQNTKLTPVSPPTVPSLPSVASPKPAESCPFHSEYDQVQDQGSLFFIHKSTQEKWKSLKDDEGRTYFHKMGSSDTRWKLPVTDEESPSPSDSFDLTTVQKEPVLETFGHQLGRFKSQRAAKTMSTYGQIESVPPSKKSSTLPASFSAIRSAPVASIPTTTDFSGYLNKCKYAEPGKKKIKKSWSQTWVVLQGSNLVFYKDQKSAPQPHGPTTSHARPEQVVSLQGAHIEINPPKEFTSKKNTILVSVSSGLQFLFQSETEPKIREWWTKMKIVANDMEPETSPKDEDKKGNIFRSISESDGSPTVDKNRNLVGIRSKLLNFIGRRPTQEDLVKRGIIKDAVFGSLLKDLCEREKEHVPKFVSRCIAAVESRGLNHDGIYRVSGNLAEIQRLRCTVDKDYNYNLHDSQWDINVLTGALKLFFRELREPVFPPHMYDRFCDAVRKEPRKERMNAFKSAINDLPRCNYFTLKELFQHLCRVTAVSHENRMQTQNVSIVFGPTLLWHSDDPTSLAVQSVVQSKVVEVILGDTPELFKS